MNDTLVLDGTKIAWHQDRLRAWERGERFAPVTVDMALTRACNYRCVYCYGTLQENERHPITLPVMDSFLHDAAEMGVRGVSLVSDGESTLSPAFEFSVTTGKALGLSMALGTNGLLVTPDVAERVLPHLDYLRVNFAAASPLAYARIMGVKPEWHRRVVENVRAMVAIKERDRLPVTLGLQMVLMPQHAAETLPLARLAVDLGVDYLVIKHCSDDEFGSLGVDYAKYPDLIGMLRQAEALSTARTRVAAKWSKILSLGKRDYSRCYGPPFILQISGSGLVAPCGMLFNTRYAKYHIGNIVETRFRDIVFSDRYWEVMDYLHSERFDARRMCGALCLQHKTNQALAGHMDGLTRNVPIERPEGPAPAHVNFI